MPRFRLRVVRLPTPYPGLAILLVKQPTSQIAGRRHGTTTGPILYSQNYVTFAEWWRVGFVVSTANLIIWLTIGFGWWKMLEYW